jgi:hypothetical protein
VTNTGLKLIDLNTGAVRSVAVSGDAGFFSSGKFASTVCGDKVFVAAKGFSKTQWTSTKSSVEQQAALVAVRHGAPSALYKIVLDGRTISVRTPDDPPKQRMSIGVAVNNPTDTTFAVAVTPSTMSIAAGQTGTVSVAVTRPEGYTGSVSLSAQGPAGFNIILTTPVLNAGSISTLMSIMPPSFQPTGTVTVNITATTSTGETATTQLTVNVAGGSSSGGGTDGSAFTISSIGGNIQQGTQANLVLLVTRLNGHTSPITLSVISTPTGVTEVFGTNPVPANQSSSLLITNVDSAVPVGAITVVVQGVDADGNTSTFGVPINVTATGGSPYTLSVAETPDTFSLAQGLEQNVVIDVTRGGGYTGSVNFVTTSVPSGFTVSFLNTLIAAGVNQTTMNVLVNSGVAPGTYSIEYVARGNGGIPLTTGTVFVTVVPAGDPSIAWDAGNTTSLNLGLYDNANVNLKLVRGGSYTGEIDVYVDSVSSSYLTAHFSPTVLTGTAVDTTLFLDFSPTAPNGTYTVNIRASGELGIASAFSPITITRG